MSQQDSYVLGINAYDHDVSACLLRNGEIAFAIYKERITRQKHATGFYQGVVDYCLAAEGISLDDVHLVVGNCCADVTEPRQSTENVKPLARESESYYRFKGSKLETLKKVWLEPVRGFLSDEFYYMPGLGALYSRASSYLFADWNKCGEV